MITSPSGSTPVGIGIATGAPEACMRPLNQIAAELLETVALLPRCEYLQTYLAPPLTVADCAGYYGMDSVSGQVGYAHDAIDYQAGLAEDVARRVQEELAAHLRNVGINL